MGTLYTPHTHTRPDSSHTKHSKHSQQSTPHPSQKTMMFTRTTVLLASLSAACVLARPDTIILSHMFGELHGPYLQQGDPDSLGPRTLQSLGATSVTYIHAEDVHKEPAVQRSITYCADPPESILATSTRIGKVTISRGQAAAKRPIVAYSCPILKHFSRVSIENLFTSVANWTGIAAGIRKLIISSHVKYVLGSRRRLGAEAILRRRKRRPTSAEVVLGRLLEEIRALQ